MNATSAKLAAAARQSRAAGVAVYGVAWGLDPATLEAAPPDGILRKPADLRDLC